MKIIHRLQGYAACFCFFVLGNQSTLVGQQKTDFSGYIAKYDSTFSGIGPEVYFLPPPKSEEELLDDRYAEKEIDSVLVDEYIDRMKYYHRLSMTGNTLAIAKYLPLTIAQTESVEGRLLVEIDRAERQGSVDLVADLENRLGMEYLAAGAFDFALEFFKKAMEIKQRNNHALDREIIAHNLAVTYESLGQLDKALGLRQELHDQAMKSRNNNQQAYTMMELAAIKAKQGFAFEAERDIIRKVVPLFRRAKNEAGRATAYRTLANIYALQHKYPEAQWFLVQAKTIADKEGIVDQMPEIIFNLAETKKQSGNPRVAIEEYIVADGLARKDNMIGMQLAIQDALGDLYHQAGNYDEAAAALSRYDTLKNMLFNGTDPVDN
ncbi:tetratricopeptide repeat protein [Parapedobacter tibetensis]|uniref:tetratricopeptide repeat protein n=1 Tax=Parapedobacter tibetensis TaxID=2972951 RepID=UPI00214D9164|nr:tetratricopeptide repeat protein [Parapedobacter tibetensis]